MDFYAFVSLVGSQVVKYAHPPSWIAALIDIYGCSCECLNTLIDIFLNQVAARACSDFIVAGFYQACLTFRG